MSGVVGNPEKGLGVVMGGLLVFSRVAWWAMRTVNYTAAAAALGCFYWAICLTNPAAPSTLAARFATLPFDSGSLSTVKVPNLAIWPFTALWGLWKPAAGFQHNQIAAWQWAATGLALLLLAAAMNYKRQDYRNRGAKLAIALFVAGLGLILADLARIVWLPISWDTATPAPSSLPWLTNGLALRAAQAVVWVYLLSLWRVMSANAVRADLFGPLWIIIRKLLVGLAIRLSVFVILLPWLREIAAWGIDRAHSLFAASPAGAGSGPSHAGEVGAFIWEISVNGFLLWAVLLGGVFQHLRDLADYLLQVMQPVALPPPPPKRGPDLDL